MLLTKSFRPINNSFTALILLASLFFVSCSGKEKENNNNLINESSVLLDYLENTGNVINSPEIPKLINADEVFENLHGSNYLVIDLRKSEDFAKGHIKTSVNIQAENILNFFENIIEPNSFDKIILICNNGFLSNHVNAVLRLLDYKNVFSLRYGLSSWNKTIAKDHWLAARSSFLENKMDKETYEKPGKGELPRINTNRKNAYNILRSRAEEVLNVTIDDITISVKDVLENQDDYFIINYWPHELYNKGHLKGAIQYTPKKSLSRDKYLLTLPVDKTIAVYCFTAHHSSWVVAYLRLLGYDVINIEYGANSFIHNTLVNTQKVTRWFKESHIHNYPLVTEDDDIEINKNETPETETITIQGGC